MSNFFDFVSLLIDTIIDDTLANERYDRPIDDKYKMQLDFCFGTDKICYLSDYDQISIEEKNNKISLCIRQHKNRSCCSVIYILPCEYKHSYEREYIIKDMEVLLKYIKRARYKKQDIFYMPHNKIALYEYVRRQNNLTYLFT